MDTWQYITPAGNTYALNDEARTFKIIEEGCGLDDLELLRSRHALQHGETTRGMYLPPRTIILGIGIYAGTLAALQDYERQYAHWLNPFRRSEVAKSYLQVIRTGGYTRRIGARLTGYSSSTGERKGLVYVNRKLRWSCDYPFFFDPTPVVVEASLGEPGGLLFPMEFPIVFGDESINTTVYPENEGDIESWPSIVVTGPGENPTITNVTTGQKMELSAGGGLTLEVGDTLTIDMENADIWWYDASGPTTTRATQYMSTDSVFWYLDLGSNEVKLEMANAANGGIELTYYNWYWWA